MREGLEIYRYDAIYPWFLMSKRLAAELDRKGANPFVPGLGSALEYWQPDLIHCHSMARIAELCLRTAKSLGIKCVVSLHGGGANVPAVEAMSLRRPTRHLLPWGKAIDYMMGWVRRIPEDADGIVCVGEDEYLKYRDRHPNVMFLPNSVDFAVFQSQRVANGAQDAKRDVRTILCMARIDRQKNQMVLVEALTRHPEINVRLVGPVTQEDYLAELKTRAQQLGVADRLTIVGALKPASPELLHEYHSADAFVLPSRHEPFGIVVLEAWACGLPVIASNVGGLGKLCAAHPDAAIVFSPDDPASLDRALAQLPEKSASLSEAGIAAAREYDWSVLAARLVDFYCNL